MIYKGILITLLWNDTKSMMTSVIVTVKSHGRVHHWENDDHIILIIASYRSEDYFMTTCCQCVLYPVYWDNYLTGHCREDSCVLGDRGLS